ncbi:MAG: TlpA family protein disulfide reductase [Pirellulales bacterium]
MIAAALIVASACLGFDPADAAEVPELFIGDPAPAITVQEFIKGEPVKAFEKDKVYVLEFWATWCQPCLKSMPHLSQLQEKHKDATFIAVNVMDEDVEAVREFVKDMDDRMAFRVAFDVPGEGQTPEGEPASGKMAAAWLDASYRPGTIPWTFIVDGQGRVAWIGNPLRLDEPLAAVLDGSWDIEAQAKEFRGEVALAKFDQNLNAAFADGDAVAVRGMVDEFIKDFPERENSVATLKLIGLLSAEGKAADAEAYTSRLIDEVLHDEWQNLSELAGILIASGEDTEHLPPDLRPGPSTKPLQALALKAASRAAKLAAKEGAAFEASARDMLARVYFVQDDVTKALEEQETAIGLTRGTQLEGEPTMIERLRTYREAAGKTESPK